MTPKTYFDDVWQRCEFFAALHGFVANQTALQPDELLRAEWAARVSALDLYIHELVATHMVNIFIGKRPICPGFARFQVSGDAMMRIHGGTNISDRAMVFDLEVRTRLSRVTYQYPDDIAEGVRLISECRLWHEVSEELGPTAAGAAVKSEWLKKELSLIINRRNKIVHEGDLQPGIPRLPWPITRSDVNYITGFIWELVEAIDNIV